MTELEHFLADINEHYSYLYLELFLSHQWIISTRIDGIV